MPKVNQSHSKPCLLSMIVIQIKAQRHIQSAQTTQENLLRSRQKSNFSALIPKDMFDMLWGCFSSAGLDALVKTDQIMSSSKYQFILAQNQLASVRQLEIKRNFTLQHDNDPKHTSKLTKPRLQKKENQSLGMAQPEHRPQSH